MKEDSLIYLASPYTHKDPTVMLNRFNQVCMAGAELMRRGEFIFSPIAHTHPMAQYDLPKNWDFWKKYDEVYLHMCSAMYVLMIDGWKESTGVSAEIKIMQELQKPIAYIDESLNIRNAVGWIKERS